MEKRLFILDLQYALHTYAQGVQYTKILKCAFFRKWLGIREDGKSLFW